MPMQISITVVHLADMFKLIIMADFVLLRLAQGVED
jgi:hypothetical protein